METVMTDVDLARFVDRWTMEHVRFYPHPVELVWRALTSAEALDAWMMPTCTLEAKAGGRCRDAVVPRRDRHDPIAQRCPSIGRLRANHRER